MTNPEPPDGAMAFFGNNEAGSNQAKNSASIEAKTEIAMAKKDDARTGLTGFAGAGVLLFLMLAGATGGNAQSAVPAAPPNPNPSTSLTLPQSSETPVSPTTPGTLPGTMAGPGTSVGTNPITGQPCLGGGSSAINGGITGAPTAPNQPGQSGQTVTGLPPNSVYGLNNQVPDTTNPGAC